MRILEPVSEDEMIAVFLKAEINSPRFGDSILKFLHEHNLDREIIDQPDTTIGRDNQLRRNLLDEYRFYTQRREGHLFENFPHSITWMRVALSREDLNRVKYINYSYWIELSNGTRRPIDTVTNIQNGVAIFRVSSQPFLDAAQTFKREPQFPEMIFVGEALTEDLIILEGHFRMTVYYLEPALIPNEITAIIGISPDLQQWRLF
jgi:hypothetical protein